MYIDSVELCKALLLLLPSDANDIFGLHIHNAGPSKKCPLPNIIMLSYIFVWGSNGSVMKSSLSQICQGFIFIFNSWSEQIGEKINEYISFFHSNFLEQLIFE